MLFLLTLALMTGATVMTVLWPLSRRAVAAPEGSGDVGFYRDQLDEIERDHARGLLSEREAESARTEAARRLLRASAAEPATSAGLTGEPALRRRRAAAALALSVVPLVGLAVYGAYGSPHLPTRSKEAVVAAVQPADEVGIALRRIEARLAEAPDDRRGWEVVAPVYLRLGRFDDAVKAYGTAVRLGADDPERLTGFGEALVGREGGVVSAEARGLFERAAAHDGAPERARFYLALAHEQDGDAAGARARYQALLAAVAANSPVAGVVRERLARLDGAAPAMTAETVAPEIRAMVAGLDERLLASGGTEAEWSRLVRSHVVLGQRDLALDRLARARAALRDDNAASTRLTAQARELGLADGAAVQGQAAR
jgi:cytochrome c-type biogenesis protein CcmH